MAKDSSLGGNTSSALFNLESPKGVTNLLASVRAGAITSEQKNELRDLIFQYTNGGRDSGTRILIEQKIGSYGVTPLQSIEKEDVANKEKNIIQHAFGTSRPSPVFPVSQQAPTPSPVIPPKPTPEPEPTPSTVIPPKPTPEPEPTPSPVIPPKPTPEPEPTPSPVIPPKPTPHSVAPVSTQPKVSASVNAKPVPVESDKVLDPAQGLQRIREIKSLVSEKIGNPVNLVDINNEVGREYMSAMLDAMKKLNTGSSAVSAMKRLENAYSLVEKTITEHDNNKHEEQKEPTVEKNEPEIMVEPVQEPHFKPLVEEKEALEFTEKPSVVTENSVPKVPVFHDNSESDLSEKEIKQPESTNSLVEEVIPEPPKPVNLSKEVDKTIESEPLEEPKPEFIPAVDSVNKLAKDTPELKDGLAHSLAETDTKLKSLTDLPNPASLETSSVDGDPLFIKEVDDGLEQLLSEWTIFKKSGLFGTGPKGREHPLFKKVAPLQIPLLLAGRFEGATQEIKQSITDYMNGWRYEQGIIYEHGEIFEHYLRRVIRHIIDLQKRGRPS